MDLAEALQSYGKRRDERTHVIDAYRAGEITRSVAVELLWAQGYTKTEAGRLLRRPR